MYENLLNIADNFMRENILYTSIILASIIGKLKESSKKSLINAWFVYFVGTLFHEFAHLVFSLVFNGKPKKISILPSKQTDEKGVTSYTLGYVSSKNMRWYNTFLISMAPLVLLPLSYYISNHFFLYFEESLMSLTFYVFLMVSLIFSSVPSSVDFSHVFNKNLLGNIIVPLVLLTLFLVLDMNQIIEFFKSLSEDLQ